jgi:hypothetical protein
VGQLERIRRTLEDLLLLPPEVEEAALKCCWLAHYWVRALAARLVACQPGHCGAWAVLLRC